MRRFALLRTTAFPILWLAAIPRRGAPTSFGKAKQVMNRPRSRLPRSYTCVNSARRRSLVMTIRLAVCGLWRGGVSARCVRSSWPCEQGSHGCAGDVAGSVETYVSLKFLRKIENFGPPEPTILLAHRLACQRTSRCATVPSSQKTLRPPRSFEHERSEWNSVSSQSFPHLCKNLWKIQGFSNLMDKTGVVCCTFAGRKSPTP